MISCVIPCYSMNNRGVEMLRELLASIRMQPFTDYEIVVSERGHVYATGKRRINPARVAKLEELKRRTRDREGVG